MSTGCATTLGDGSVIVTGGQTDPQEQGSRKVQVFNISRGTWEDRADMRHARLYHSCAQVWIDPQSIPFINHLGNHSVASVMVVGGKELTSKLQLSCFRSYL